MGKKIQSAAAAAESDFLLLLGAASESGNSGSAPQAGRAVANGVDGRGRIVGSAAFVDVLVDVGLAPGSETLAGGTVVDVGRGILVEGGGPPLSEAEVGWVGDPEGFLGSARNGGLC